MVLHMKFKEKPDMDDSPFLNDKYHKDFQHIIGVCQWLIFVGVFYLSYAASSLSRFSDAPRVGHLDLVRKIFGYLRNYPKLGYEINPHPLIVDADYEKVQMNYYFVNQYSYFSEDIGDQFPEPLLDELDIRIFLDANRVFFGSGINTHNMAIKTPDRCENLNIRC